MYSRQNKTAKASAKDSDTPASNQFAPRRFLIQKPVPQTPQNPNLQAQSAKVEQSEQGIQNLNIFKYHPPRQPLGIQMKLSIGQPGDKYEQEADQVAADVVQRINAPESEEVQRMDVPEEQEELQMKPAVDSIQRMELPEDEENLQMKPAVDSIQRMELPEDEENLQMKPAVDSIQRMELPNEEEELQMKPAVDSIQRMELPEDEENLQMKPMVQRLPAENGMAASPDLEASIQKARGSGQPLSDKIRKPIEQAFGADFSGVKVHTDSQSDQLNQSIQAKAFTTGQDVFFRQGAYDPGSRGGQELIAHELTHVVQQNGNSIARKLTADIGESDRNSQAQPVMQKSEGSAASQVSSNTSASVIQRGLWDSIKKGFKKLGGANETASEEKAQDPEPLCLTQTFDPSSLSDDAIKQEIQVIGKWIAQHQASSPDAQKVASSLKTLELEVEARAAVAAVKKLPGWGKMAADDQAILENMLKGRENAVSQTVRIQLQGLKAVLSSQTDVEQAQTLTGLINAKESLPDVVNEPVTTTQIKYTLEGPTTENDYAFRGKTADAEKWVVKFEDGVNIPIVAPKAPEPGYHNHSVQQAAEAASYLPKANRSVMTTILLNAVVNPDDAYWAVEYNTPDFHSYMTAGQAGVVTIYPNRVSQSLPDDNYMRGTMIHETGHTWSYKTWGTDTKKGKWVDWQQAMDKDKVSVSGYAMNSIDEDVAETIQIYTSTKGSSLFDEYSQIVPHRFKMLDVEYK